MVKVVIVSTSANVLQDHWTGVWLEELATPYYLFKEKGYQVVLASPKGGHVPIDASSMKGDFFTEDCKRFMEDEDAQKAIEKTQVLAKVDFASVDAIYLAGGHGTCVDFVDNEDLRRAIELLHSSGKVVAADCHGPIGLAQCLNPDGSSLLKGKTVTGFTNEEEDAVQLTSKVPFLIETKFKELGANYEKADNWHPKVCVDGKLCTGQNPQSSEALAKEVIKLLG